MLRKFLPGWGFILPLSAHCLVHSVLTFVITFVVVYYKPGNADLLWQLPLFDFVCHFAIDRIKASPKLLGRFKPLTASNYPASTDKEKRSNVLFWYSLGLDQMVHHLTHYIIIWNLI